MSRLNEAPPRATPLASARKTPVVVRVPAVKAGAVVDILANAALRWLCRAGARAGVPMVMVRV